MSSRVHFRYEFECISLFSVLRVKTARLFFPHEALAGDHSVCSQCFALQTSSHACRVTLPLSALAPLLIKETGFLLSELRQASEQQELVHKSTGPLVFGPESEVSAPDFRFPFLCGCCACSSGDPSSLCSSCVEPAALRVRRVRPNRSEDVRTDGVIVARVSWIVSSKSCWAGPLVTGRVGWVLVTIL